MLGMATLYCKLIVNFSYWYRIFIIKPVSKHLPQQKIIKVPLWATWYNFPNKNRSSLSEVFCKKGVPRNFSKFAGKHLWQSLFFNKGAGKPATSLKKRPWHRRFPVNFEKFLKNSVSHSKPPMVASAKRNSVGRYNCKVIFPYLYHITINDLYLYYYVTISNDLPIHKMK